MPRDKQGQLLTWKQFFHRWKEGIDGITALQQTNSQIQATLIMTVGVLCGLVISIINWKNVWWLTIVLTGALFNTLIQLLGLLQKRNILKRFEINTMEVQDD